MRNAHCRNWNMARKVKNVEIEIQTLQDVKYVVEYAKKKKKKKNLKIMENEKNTQQDLEYGEKHGNTWKMRHKHCMTWKMVRNTEEGGK